MRVNQLFKMVPARIIAVLTMAVFLVGTFASTAWAGDSAIVTFNTPTRLENMEIDLSWQKINGREMDYSYPSFEIVAIDGIPWQDTVHAEAIKADFGFYTVDSSFHKHPELMEIVLDKRFNGRGFEVWELLEQGKTAPEVKEILLNRSPRTPKAYAFDCESISKNELDAKLQARYGEPVDAFGIRLSRSAIAKAEPPKSQPNETPIEELLPSEAPGELTVALFLDRMDYSVGKDGVWTKAKMNVAPLSEQGRTLVPLRGVLEQFGATVDWLPETRQITAHLGDKEVMLTLGSTTALVNGTAFVLDVPPKVIDGHTLIPLRFVSEQLGMSVKWDDASRSVTIKQK